MSHLASDTNMVSPGWSNASISDDSNCAMTMPGADALRANISLSDIVYAAGRATTGANKSRRTPVCPCPTWKRMMDIFGSIVGLTLLWPLFAIVGVYIKCVSRGPVFFRQRRYGTSEQPFDLWKFRTMEVTQTPMRHLTYVADLMHNDQPLKKIDDELAIIPGARILRKLGIDELPQLINVLNGEMSLVGPRPDVMPPSAFHHWRRHRFDVSPGITGLWQVSGKNRTTFSEMMQLDMAYIRRRSLWLDVTILLRTFLAVVRN